MDRKRNIFKAYAITGAVSMTKEEISLRDEAYWALQEFFDEINYSNWCPSGHDMERFTKAELEFRDLMDAAYVLGRLNALMEQPKVAQAEPAPKLIASPEPESTSEAGHELEQELTIEEDPVPEPHQEVELLPDPESIPEPITAPQPEPEAELKPPESSEEDSEQEPCLLAMPPKESSELEKRQWMVKRGAEIHRSDDRYTYEEICVKVKREMREAYGTNEGACLYTNKHLAALIPNYLAFGELPRRRPGRPRKH